MAVELQQKLSSLVNAAIEKKCERLVIMDVRSLCSYTDYIVICSGTSTKQVQAIARYVEERLDEEGVRPLGTEGMKEGNWVLMDYNDIVFHVFYEPVRVFYSIEDIYLDAPRYEISEEGEEAVREIGRRLFAS